MPLEGFGSEVSLTAIVLLGLKVARDFLKERGEKKQAITVANTNGVNPKSGTSTNLVLHVLKEHGEKLKECGEQFRVLNKDVTDVKINLAEINTKLNMKQGG